MQQGHDLIQYGGSLLDAIRFSQRALDIATRLDDDALAYGARFSLGQAYWITGSYAEGIRVLTANVPENLHKPERVRDFGTTGSLMMDSLSILGACHAYQGNFDQSTIFLTRALGLVTSAAFDFSVVQYHLNRAHLQRGDAATALPLLVKAVQHATDAGLKFTHPWLLGCLGYAKGLVGDLDEGIEILGQAITESEQLALPQVKVFAAGFLVELFIWGKKGQPVELADAAMTIALTNGYRGQEAELLRLKGAALSKVNPVEATVLISKGLALARALGMRPEEAHALRTLGDIKGNPSAQENREGAQTIYRLLGMTYWLGSMS
jgi:tetratricopeptide (TPR) repeat protein